MTNDLNKLIEFSKLHPCQISDNIFKFRNWEVWSNDTEQTWMRVLYKNMNIDDFKNEYNQFSLLAERWELEPILDKSKYYIKDFVVNKYGIYILIRNK